MIFSLLPPPNPLVQRKHIPLNSPRFGKQINYIKLAPFISEENEKEEYYPLSTQTNIHIEERFEKAIELSLYINCSTMLE